MGSPAAGPLASWREGPARTAVLRFLDEALTPGAEAFGVAPEDVIGSALRLAFEHRDGRSVLVRLPEFLGSPNQGAPKPIRIQDHDDAERDYAYAGASFIDPHAEQVLTSAARRGWAVVSMARAWERVF